MNLEGEEAVTGDLGEVQHQPVHVKKDDEGSGCDDGDLGIKGVCGEHQHNDGEDGKILEREGQYDDYTNEEENDSPTNDETHNSDQSSSTSRAQLNRGKCYIF